MLSPSVLATLVLSTTRWHSSPVCPQPPRLCWSTEKQVPDLRVPALHSALSCVLRL